MPCLTDWCEREQSDRESGQKGSQANLTAGPLDPGQFVVPDAGGQVDPGISPVLVQAHHEPRRDNGHVASAEVRDGVTRALTGHP